MRLIIQRCLSGSVSVGDQLVSQIGKGLVVLLGIHERDTKEVAKKLAHKLSKIRLWEKENKAWNGSCVDFNYEILIVSQFTLYAYMKGNKPDFHYAMDAEKARELYEYFVDECGKAYKPEKIKKGAFQQYMAVNIVNDGPVTIEIDEMEVEKQQKQQKQQIQQQQQQPQEEEDNKIQKIN
ncbi:unnamed protein product [Paramecium octaurelia]|uniref:D-aminoacyl-tRNA deacylase n=1 Tax=Paramecium octaurelia TaxID=43137 RepID=A0A8S1XKH1_PAROT|nr:unnamed protein product [Paramecium octaurelia]